VLQSPDGGDGIQIVVVTKVSNAEELALHFSLAIGDHCSETVAEGLNDISGVDAWRLGDSGQSGAW